MPQAERVTGRRSIVATGVVWTVVAAQALPVLAYVVGVLVPYAIGVARYGGHDALLHDPNGPHDPKNISALMVGGSLLLSLPLDLVGALAAAYFAQANGGGVALSLAACGALLLAGARALYLGRAARWALALAGATSALTVAVASSAVGHELVVWLND